LLIRHATCDGTGDRLHGRSRGVRLNGQGRREAAELAFRLAARPLQAVYASPADRAVETAAAIAQQHSLDVTPCSAVDELDFGEWTGRTLDELRREPGWLAFNRLRSMNPPPRGELMLQTQARSVVMLTDLVQRHEAGTFAMVSHADVIRALVAFLLGMPLDHLLRIRVDPASVTEFGFHGVWPELIRLNCTSG
jgi:broad specificity phosphatase PhoE